MPIAHAAKSDAIAIPIPPHDGRGSRQDAEAARCSSRAKPQGIRLPKECRPPIVEVQEIVEDGREMPVVKDDAAVQHVEVHQGQNAKEQAERARTTNFDEAVYNLKLYDFGRHE